MINIQSSATVNHVVWVTSLSDNEKGVTNRIFEDTESYLNSKGICLEKVEPKNADELRQFLKGLADKAEEGLKPIIHFDVHGTAERGLHIHCSNEYISWHDIVSLLRDINIKTENNLCVISFACFSFELIRKIDLAKASPFYFFAAPQKEVNGGFVEDKCCQFYTDLFNEEDILKSYKNSLSERMCYLHSEKLLFEILAKYIKNNTMGKSRNKRVERLITLFLSNIGYSYNGKLSKFRKFLKKNISPNSDLLDRYVKSFLIGKRVSYTIDDVIEYAKQCK